MDKKSIIFAKIKIFSSVGLVLALFIVGLAFFARPKISENEKRQLTKFPAFTFESFMSGEFTSQVSLWFSDTYPLREPMIEANGVLQSLHGIRDEQFVGSGNSDKIPSGPANVVFNPTDNGKGEGFEGLYLNNDTAYQLYFFNKQNSDSYVALINEFSARVKGKATVYDMIVPLHHEIALSESTIKKYNASDCGDAIDYMYSNLSSSVKSVDTLPYLIAHNNEYLYFRTDHHWTARGAYYAYLAFCEEKGIEPTPLEDYQKLQYDEFLGTFYLNEHLNRPAAMSDKPDYVEAFIPNGTNIAVLHAKDGTVDYDSRVIFTKLTKSNKYLCFIGGDNPLVEIHNPKINDGSSIVVIKESFGNAFVPFLVDSYEYVYVIDYREWNGDLADFVIDNGIDDVLFLNVISNTSTSDRLVELATIIK